MANQLPSKRWRTRVSHNGKQVSAHTIIGGPVTFAKRWEAEQAEAQARDALLGKAQRGVTLAEWFETWSTSKLWQRPSESTNVHNRERCRKFVAKYGHLPIRSIGDDIVAEWIAGGQNVGTINSLRTLFGDARKKAAGTLISANPFSDLGLTKTHGRRDAQPPDEQTIARMIQIADQLCPPSFAAWLDVACWSAARPGELDALKWEDIDFQAEEIHIRKQWNVKLGKFTDPKHGSSRTIAMTPPVRRRLLSLPRESEFVFTTLRGHHYTPSTRSHHWNRVRCTAQLAESALYLCTRHFFGWYALNVLGEAPHTIAKHLGHTDGGELVRTLYGHADERIARDNIREAFRNVTPVTPLPRAAAA